MATAVKKKIVVCGGNGFLGSRICKAATARGWDVTSVRYDTPSAKPPAPSQTARSLRTLQLTPSRTRSRSGEPTWSSVTSSATAPPWSTSVHWARADMLKPASYTSLLHGADAVVHSMGILLEADYKGVLTGKESPLRGLQRAFSASKGGSQNPLERQAGEELRPQERDGQLTYELMNRDSAITLAQEAAAAGARDFVYISAAAGAPVLPKRYITTKREAEATIAREMPGMRSVFIRPGFLYDASRSFTMPLAALTAMGAVFNSLTGGYLSGLMGAGGTKPLKADLVGEAVVEAIADERVKGPVETGEIEELANRAWRRGML
ncbi:hypothetical protein LTR16_002029 [Cryomyces antarcticus]|uniref:NAD-dependent epimerase/dehydratase domain-containing protein n=1 Tax=Cryomyces antarcticus TaxID=329879 RepID=A0ABR0KTI4_9PEZI|nr:hypothetical protein LTR39_001706 [Cryomyces antarcticus]KAK5129631.1 hypothetical protein LTR16_002029 [Cryomyces antarcticus]